MIVGTLFILISIILFLLAGMHHPASVQVSASYSGVIVGRSAGSPLGALIFFAVFSGAIGCGCTLYSIVQMIDDNNHKGR